MDEMPGLHHVIIPVTWGGFMGLILGTIISFGIPDEYAYLKPFIMAFVIVVGCFVGWFIAGWLLGKREDYVWYQAGGYALPEIKKEDTVPAPKPAGPAVILLEDKLKGITYRLSLWDMSFQEWIEVAKLSVNSGYA